MLVGDTSKAGLEKMLEVELDLVNNDGLDLHKAENVIKPQGDG